MLVAAFVVSGAAPAFAETASTSVSSLSVLLGQIVELQKTINELQAKMADLRKQEKEVKQDIREVKREFRSQLREGMTSDEIRDLQELLSQHPDLYPEGRITGFFGPLTRKAVERFQKKHDISTIGVVGPQTRAKLNALIASGEFTFIPLNGKRGLDGLIIPGTGSSTATSTNGMGKIVLCHKEGRHGRHTIEVATPAVSAHLFHGDNIGACKNEDHDDDDGDDNDDHNATTTDMTAPVISSVAATSTSASAATIVWDTNEQSKTTVRYATTTPVISALNQVVAADASLVFSHSMMLSGLSASTTYYFFVESQDAAGNTATSSEMWFMTL